MKNVYNPKIQQPIYLRHVHGSGLSSSCVQLIILNDYTEMYEWNVLQKRTEWNPGYIKKKKIRVLGKWHEHHQNPVKNKIHEVILKI